MARIALQHGKVFKVASVGQDIEVDDCLIGMTQPIKDEIAANKTVISESNGTLEEMLS